MSIGNVKGVNVSGSLQFQKKSDGTPLVTISPNVGLAVNRSSLATFAGTNQTITAAQLAGGFIEGSPTGAATYTFDSGANLDAAFPDLGVGDYVDAMLTILTAQVVTWAAGAGNAIRVRTATTTGTVVGEVCSVTVRKTGTGAWTVYIVPGSSAT